MKPHVPENLPLKDLEWKHFIRHIGPANAALARYDGILQGIPDPQLLLNPLTTQEAVLSSQIEGTQATLEEVLAYEGADISPEGEKKREDITEILNYRRAMQYAIEELKTKPMSLNLLHKLHFILLDSVRGHDKGRGEFRKTQNWIGRLGSPIEQAKYVPPEPSRVMNCMSNLEKYIHHDEEDRLVQLAIIHGQFELIHPYSDGNGRLGRMLVPLFLFEKNQLSSPMFYTSAYLEAHRPEYYARLNAISREGDWTGWVRFFLGAVIDQAKTNTNKARAILDLYRVTLEKIPIVTKSRYATKTVDALFRMPIFDSSRFMAYSGIPRDTALRIVKQLEKSKTVARIREQSGRRPATYAFKELLEVVKQ